MLLSYSLGAASPVALADVLAPAAAAAIVGGVSVAAAARWALRRSGLSAIGVEPHVHDLVTGIILMVIAIVDAPDLARRVTAWRLDRAEGDARLAARRP